MSYPSSEYLLSVCLHDPHVLRRSPEVEQELAVALGDLQRENRFALKAGAAGPYDMTVMVADNRMTFSLTSERLGEEPYQIRLPVAPFRGIIRDYFMICESYFEAVKASDPYKVEAVDMGRRGIHNEGSELLQKLLSEKASIDFDTARRLFTLVCVLHIR